MSKAENAAALFGRFGLSLILTAGLALHAAAPSKELLDYVREASRLGLADKEIQENAVKAGWPAATVAEAIKNAKQSTPPESQAKPAQAAAKDAGSKKPESKAVQTKRTESLTASAAKPAGRPVASNTKTPQPTNPVPPAEAAPKDPAAPAESRSQATQQQVTLPYGYVIGAGDTLRIDVWDEPKASVGGTIVRPDGRIGMPLLKEVEVIGLTPAEAEKLITEKLATLIPGADVTVVVTGIASPKIYMIGGVKREGSMPYTYRMTVLQALSEAGGLNDYAKRKKIYILRTQNGKEYRLPFDYDAVLRGEKMELNITLLPGDTLVVPR